MKKAGIIFISLILSAAGLSAQPRAFGVRTGITGFDMSYQHTIGKKNFVQTDLSLDFGYAGSGEPGFSLITADKHELCLHMIGKIGQVLHTVKRSR